jgi:transcriptional regulator with XRE-family HTH domain
MTTSGEADPAKVAREEPQQRGRVPADTFSNRLLLARVLAGHLSIREACERTGLNRGNWQGWERGLRPRDMVEVCELVARALDVDFNWLLLGGPLAGPRGRLVTKRSGGDTTRYPKVAERPTPNRPKVRRDPQMSPPTAPTSRRANRVGTALTDSDGQPVAA